MVTEDGAETDLDLGHYERFTAATLTRKNSISAGQIYQHVVKRERRGDYLGATVQVIPHVTKEIQDRVEEASRGVDVALVEVGGTVGDIESLPFLEALRQFRHVHGASNCLCIHLVLVPYLENAGEVKTKPAQHSVNKLREIGIQPDILICRSRVPLEQDIREKLALFTSVPVNCVIPGMDIDCIYEVPLLYRQEGLHERIFTGLSLHNMDPPPLQAWETCVKKYKKNQTKNAAELQILLVGKYVGLQESYKSLIEALEHAALEHAQKLKIEFMDAENNEENNWNQLAHVHGILVPGGFGERGIEGKIHAVRYAREQHVPFLGICLGLQAAVIEFARNVAGLHHAQSGEFRQYPGAPEVISMMSSQLTASGKKQRQKGGTMRLGGWSAELSPHSLAQCAYRTQRIKERHRHRYEVNNQTLPQLEAQGLKVTGRHKPLNLVEVIELPGHPWFLGCQFHPEFKSKPGQPHPLFTAFLAAAAQHKPSRQAVSPPEATPTPEDPALSLDIETSPEAGQAQ